MYAHRLIYNEENWLGLTEIGPGLLETAHKEGYITLKDLVDCQETSSIEKINIILSSGIMSDSERALMLCDLAEMVVVLFEENFSGDSSLRNALEAKRSWLNKEISGKELLEHRENLRHVHSTYMEVFSLFQSKMSQLQTTTARFKKTGKTWEFPLEWKKHRDFWVFASEAVASVYLAIERRRVNYGDCLDSCLNRCFWTFKYLYIFKGFCFDEESFFRTQLQIIIDFLYKKR
jgi:hypothetical protein